MVEEMEVKGDRVVTEAAKVAVIEEREKEEVDYKYMLHRMLLCPAYIE
tara:strand:+ start:214 stop:357 length:144 start_codon:yes stop_codon:yes gene_type:complete